ncbi:MAG: ABC transporter substrate-binding protein, partial [Acidimicrobiia bacterium]
TTTAAATTTTAAATTTTAAASTTTTAADECAIDQLELVEPGVLTVATGEPAFPPWVIDDDPTNQQGFEAAVAYAIAERLGFTPDQVTWVRTGFDEAIAPGPKDFDFNLQQYSITDERDEVVDFSIPYYVTDQALVAFADTPVTEANTVADLKGYVLGAQIGTTSLDYIEEIIQPDTPPPVYDTNSDAKSALEAGQVDALVFDLPTAYFITAVEIPEATIVGVLEASEGQADRFGLLFADGNPLVDCVNGALESLEADGTLDALAEEWLAQAGEIKTITR